MGVGPIFVIVPAYNAEQTVEGVFKRIPESTRRRIARYIVVDDGSTDDTQGALERVAKSFENLVVLTHDHNLGYGAAEKTLLSYAKEHGANVAVLLHSDGQYSPERMTALLEPIDDRRADLVQGSRMLKSGALQGGMPFYKYISNKLLTAVENVAFGMTMAEYHSGYMVYSRRAMEVIPFERLSNTFLFDLEMIIAARILGLAIEEVAIPTIYADEVSYLNPVKYGLEVLGAVVSFKRGDYHKLLGLTKERY